MPIRAQVVRSTVPEASRQRYMRAWTEWSGSLYAMGIRAELLESEEEPGEFTEITWFGPGDEGALADDRVVRADDALTAAAARRSGERQLHARVE